MRCVPFTPSFKRQNIHKFVLSAFGKRSGVDRDGSDCSFLFWSKSIGFGAFCSCTCVVLIACLLACYSSFDFSLKTDHVKWKWK
jgi:hypothetical protein